MMDDIQQGRAEAKLCKIAVDLALPGKIEPGPQTIEEIPVGGVESGARRKRVVLDLLRDPL
jgi:hypothetical protein